MTHADDEFLSALLDEEPAPGDAAHVEHCDVCQSRMSALRHASNAMASPVIPPSPHLREAALAAALQAADEPLRVAALQSVGKPVPMRSARRKAARGQRMNSLSAAAALVVALAVGGWAISQIGTDSDNLSPNTALESGVADSAGAATPTAGLGAENATSGDNTFAAGGSEAAPYDAGELGEINDVALVVQRARTDLGQSAESQAEKRMREPSPCPYDEPNVAVWQATLTYNGVAAVAHLVRGADDKEFIQILRRADCSLIATQESAPTSPR